MAFFDMPLEKLRKFRPAVEEPKDFDAFWTKTLRETARFPLDARFKKLAEPVFNLVDAYDVTFNGFGGQPIKGWFIEPAGNTKRLPCVVSYAGYGGGRGFALEHMGPVVAGMAHLFMDTRGQGSSWGVGDTADDASTGPQYPGFMTKGIQSPEDYYYRRVFTDAARAVAAAAGHAHVDASRIAVAGGSQGGGIAIAAAALCGRKVRLAMPEVPFLCHYRRAISITDSSPYSEITQYLKTHRDHNEMVFRTLSYFDGVNFAARISARCLFTVGLMDNVCPPSTVFAAYNRIKARKDILVYEFNNHEGGGSFAGQAKLLYALKHL